MSGPSPKAQLNIAVCLLAGFTVVVALMLAWADTWEQRVYVFGAVEAIVFTAVGWVFGREVHRQSAETAQQDAAEAKQDAKVKTEEVKQLTKEAEKGRTFAKAVANARTTAAPAPAATTTTRRGVRDVGAENDEDVPTGDPTLASLQALAAELYE